MPPTQTGQTSCALGKTTSLTPTPSRDIRETGWQQHWAVLPSLSNCFPLPKQPQPVAPAWQHLPAPSTPYHLGSAALTWTGMFLHGRGARWAWWDFSSPKALFWRRKGSTVGISETGLAVFVVGCLFGHFVRVLACSASLPHPSLDLLPSPNPGRRET